MKQYLDLLEYVLDNGEHRGDRTGTGTIATFSTYNRYNLINGFPAVTTKKLFWKGVVHELLWMIKGDTNIQYLVNNGVHIWDDDAFRHYRNNHKLLTGVESEIDKDNFVQWVVDLAHEPDSFNADIGDLGPIYGAQWRAWGAHSSNNGYGIDQLNNLIHEIKNNPTSRRLILSSWNVKELGDMALPPCHVMVQFYVSNDGRLSCQMIQRSADLFLGAPFNIASYALLTHMIAQVCKLQPGYFVHIIGDAHIYTNHITQVEEQLKRKPLLLPTLELNPTVQNIDDFTFDDINLVGYESHPPIKAALSVGL